ncbi:MAG: hypothetical protein HN904_09650 [Victivallales bacterium]|jgi:hypothetical protein|nr:hypothetical protein [Rhodospirillaceae bacterium]MBT7163032.1 hypothetical protein [Victivallales bacterium]
MTFVSLASETLDVAFAEFGVDALYTPQGGTSVNIRAIATRPDEIVGFGDTRVHAETALFEIRVSEVSQPRPGDLLTVDGADHIIQGEPERRDPHRLVWALDTRPA